MLSFILIAALLQPPDAGVPEPVVSPRQFLIVHDDGRNSQILVSELTRDWSAPVSGLDSAAACVCLVEMNRRRDSAMRCVVLADRCNSASEFRRLPEYPVWRYGDYGQIQTFDERAFTGSGRALETVETIIARTTDETTAWKNECENLIQQSRREHIDAARSWLWDTLTIDTLQEGLGEHCDNMAWVGVSFPKLQRRFGNYDGYPVYVEPELPPCPVRRFPWEAGR